MVFKKERREVIKRWLSCVTVLGCASVWPLPLAKAKETAGVGKMAMKLPVPRKTGALAVEAAIGNRRTVRRFRSQMLSLDQVTQLLWAGQGITGMDGLRRAAPSAGALYPMDLYLAVGDGVQRIDAGLYRYHPKDHRLFQIVNGDLRPEIATAALSQAWLAKAPVSLVITAEYDRAAVKYGKRAVRYAMIEAGHIGQNIFLQAEALGLKAGIIGAFHDNALNKILRVPKSHRPLLIMPVGYA